MTTLLWREPLVEKVPFPSGYESRPATVFPAEVLCNSLHGRIALSVRPTIRACYSRSADRDQVYREWMVRSLTSSGRKSPVALTEVLTTVKLIQAGKAALDHLKGRMESPEDIAQLNQLYEIFQTLREENIELREELRRRDAAAAARANYERRKMGRAVVRVRVEADGKDGPPCCPKCN